MNNANNGIKFDNSNDVPATPVNSFGGTTVGLNSPILGENQSQMNNNTPVVENISLDSKGVVQEIKVNQNEENLCPFCGYRVQKSSSMCMHCGRILGNAKDMTGAMGAPRIEDETAVEYIDIVTQSPRPAFITTMILFVISVISIIAVTLLFKIPILLVSIIPTAIAFFYSYIIERLLIKANLPWWGYFIPVYNIFLISKLLTNRYAFILWYVIPIIIYSLIANIFAKSILLYFGIVILVFELYISFTIFGKFADRFNANKWLLFFFPYIMLPVIALKERYVCF